MELCLFGDSRKGGQLRTDLEQGGVALEEMDTGVGGGDMMALQLPCMLNGAKRWWVRAICITGGAGERGCMS